MAWQLKRKAEDFIVDEILDDVTEERWKDKIDRIRGHGPSREKGKYLWLTMKKHDMDFFKAIDLLAGSLRISTRSVSYSGTKDRRAVTSQTVSVLGADDGDVRKIAIPGMELCDFRYRRRHVKLGEHSGNRFRITIRNVGPDDVPGTRERIENIIRKGIVNYFGEQRFGSLRKANDTVGRYLVMGDFENAVMSFLTITSDSEPENTSKARTKLLRTGDIGSAAEEFPHVLDHELAMINHLAGRPYDHIGALRRLPLRLLKLFVHAYQSHIWNLAAKACSSNSPEQVTIPLVGYKTKLERYGKVKGIVARIMKKEGVEAGMFRNKAFPRLSSAGSSRDLFAYPRDLSYEFRDDDMNQGKKKMVLSFELGKGSYATELVRQIKPDIPGSD